MLHRSINDKNAVHAKHIRKVGYRYCSIASKFLEIRLENWTKQKKHDSNCDKLRTKKNRFVSKKKGFFFLQSSMEWALTVGVAVDSKCNPCQQFNFISLFLYLWLIFALGNPRIISAHDMAFTQRQRPLATSKNLIYFLWANGVSNQNIFKRVACHMS